MQKKASEDFYSVINERKDLFAKIVAQSKKCLMNKEYELAAVYTQFACNYASINHSGFFYSQEIEGILKSLSFSVIKIDIKKISNYKIEKVLHITSEVYNVGGHTGLIKNWVEYDSNRINDLVITNQSQNESPTQTIDYFINKKCSVYFLKKNAKGIIDRAQYLYNLSKKYDAIVLHIHPYDVIPLIALSYSEIPILFMNHSDHRFWIGKNIANAVLEIRSSGKMLSNNRRLIGKQHQFILPLPLKERMMLSKKQARQYLNLNEKETIVFSVASAFKYKPLKDDGIRKILLPLITKFKDIKIVIVGPHISEDYWKKMYEESNGKIEAVGVKPFIDYYYIAADIYLDSYPLSSLTSLLDAAKYGLPIFSIDKGEGVLDLDDISLDELDFKSKSFEEIIEKISIHIKDRTRREMYGLECFHAINKFHLNPNWSFILNDIYEKAIMCPKIENKNDSSNIGDNDLSLLYLYNKDKSRRYEYLSSISSHFELLPFLKKVEYFPDIIKLIYYNPSFIKLLFPRSWKIVIKKMLAEN